MYNFLAQIDGRKSYAAIAEIVGIEEEQLMNWSLELKALYILD